MHTSLDQRQLHQQLLRLSSFSSPTFHRPSSTRQHLTAHVSRPSPPDPTLTTPQTSELNYSVPYSLPPLPSLPTASYLRSNQPTLHHVDKILPVPAHFCDPETVSFGSSPSHHVLPLSIMSSVSPPHVVPNFSQSSSPRSSMSSRPDSELCSNNATSHLNEDMFGHSPYIHDESHTAFVSSPQMRVKLKSLELDIASDSHVSEYFVSEQSTSTPTTPVIIIDNHLNVPSAHNSPLLTPQCQHEDELIPMQIGASPSQSTASPSSSDNNELQDDNNAISPTEKNGIKSNPLLAASDRLNPKMLIYISDFWDQKTKLENNLISALQALIRELQNLVSQELNQDAHSHEHSQDDTHNDHPASSTGIRDLVNAYLTQELLLLENMQFNIRERLFYSADLREFHAKVVRTQKQEDYRLRKLNKQHSKEQSPLELHSSQPFPLVANAINPAIHNATPPNGQPTFKHQVTSLDDNTTNRLASYNPGAAHITASSSKKKKHYRTLDHPFSGLPKSENSGSHFDNTFQQTTTELQQERALDEQPSPFVDSTTESRSISKPSGSQNKILHQNDQLKMKPNPAIYSQDSNSGGQAQHPILFPRAASPLSSITNSQILSPRGGAPYHTNVFSLTDTFRFDQIPVFVDAQPTDSLPDMHGNMGAAVLRLTPRNAHSVAASSHAAAAAAQGLVQNEHVASALVAFDSFRVQALVRHHYPLITATSGSIKLSHFSSDTTKTSSRSSNFDLHGGEERLKPAAAPSTISSSSSHSMAAISASSPVAAALLAQESSNRNIDDDASDNESISSSSIANKPLNSLMASGNWQLQFQRFFQAHKFEDGKNTDARPGPTDQPINDSFVLAHPPLIALPCLPPKSNNNNSNDNSTNGETGHSHLHLHQNNHIVAINQQSNNDVYYLSPVKSQSNNLTTNGDDQFHPPSDISISDCQKTILLSLLDPASSAATTSTTNTATTVSPTSQPNKDHHVVTSISSTIIQSFVESMVTTTTITTTTTSTIPSKLDPESNFGLKYGLLQNDDDEDDSDGGNNKLQLSSGDSVYASESSNTSHSDQHNNRHHLPLPSLSRSSSTDSWDMLSSPQSPSIMPQKPTFPNALFSPHSPTLPMSLPEDNDDCQSVVIVAPPSKLDNPPLMTTKSPGPSAVRNLVDFFSHLASPTQHRSSVHRVPTSPPRPPQPVVDVCSQPHQPPKSHHQPPPPSSLKLPCDLSISTSSSPRSTLCTQPPLNITSRPHQHAQRPATPIPPSAHFQTRLAYWNALQANSPSPPIQTTTPIRPTAVQSPQQQPASHASADTSAISPPPLLPLQLPQSSAALVSHSVPIPQQSSPCLSSSSQHLTLQDAATTVVINPVLSIISADESRAAASLRLFSQPCYAPMEEYHRDSPPSEQIHTATLLYQPSHLSVAFSGRSSNHQRSHNPTVQLFEVPSPRKSGGEKTTCGPVHDNAEPSQQSVSLHSSSYLSFQVPPNTQRSCGEISLKSACRTAAVVAPPHLQRTASDRVVDLATATIPVELAVSSAFVSDTNEPETTQQASQTIMPGMVVGCENATLTSSISARTVDESAAQQSQPPHSEQNIIALAIAFSENAYSADDTAPINTQFTTIDASTRHVRHVPGGADVSHQRVSQSGKLDPFFAPTAPSAQSFEIKSALYSSADSVPQQLFIEEPRAHITSATNLMTSPCSPRHINHHVVPLPAVHSSTSTHRHHQRQPSGQLSWTYSRPFLPIPFGSDFEDINNAHRQSQSSIPISHHSFTQTPQVPPPHEVPSATVSCIPHNCSLELPGNNPLRLSRGCGQDANEESIAELPKHTKNDDDSTQHAEPNAIHSPLASIAVSHSDFGANASHQQPTHQTSGALEQTVPDGPSGQAVMLFSPSEASSIYPQVITAAISELSLIFPQVQHITRVEPLPEQPTDSVRPNIELGSRNITNDAAVLGYEFDIGPAIEHGMVPDGEILGISELKQQVFSEFGATPAISVHYDDSTPLSHNLSQNPRPDVPPIHSPVHLSLSLLSPKSATSHNNTIHRQKNNSSSAALSKHKVTPNWPNDDFSASGVCLAHSLPSPVTLYSQPLRVPSTPKEVISPHRSRFTFVPDTASSLNGNRHLDDLSTTLTSHFSPRANQ